VAPTNRALVAVISAGALLAGVLTVAVLVTMPAQRLTTLAASSPSATLVQILGALGLLGAGVLTCLTSARMTAGLALLVAGVAFCAPVWVGWEGGSLLARGLGAVLAPLLLPALLDLASRGTGSRRRRAVSAAVAAGYAATAAYSVARALVADPFLDPYCWANCTAAPFLVTPAPELVGRLDMAWVLLSTVLTLGAIGAAAEAGPGWQRRDTRSRAAVAVMAAACAVAGVTPALLEWADPARPTRPALQALFVLLGLGLTLLAVAATWQVWQPWAQRVALNRFSRDVATANALPSVEAALRVQLADADLQLGYRVPAEGLYVDAEGRPLTSPAPENSILVTHQGRQVAAVYASTTAQLALEEALRPAVRLALENERLAAEARFHLERVTESRSRIVATADSARRTLERDLHDGAQQRLLAVLYRLRVAAAEEAQAGASAGVRTGVDFDDALAETTAALAELRHIAHGVFPAVLESAGLPAALATLVERSGVPTRLEVALRGRLPPEVERAAYWTVAALLEHPPDGVMTSVQVQLSHAASEEVLTVRLQPVAPPSLAAVADRTGAVRGTVHLTEDAVEVMIPCG
jgi:signal transduction histidine kinase